MLPLLHKMDDSEAHTQPEHCCGQIIFMQKKKDDKKTNP